MCAWLALILLMQNFLYVIYTFEKRMATAEARGCHPENFVKFLKTPFLQNTSVRLILP